MKFLSKGMTELYYSIFKFLSELKDDGIHNVILSIVLVFKENTIGNASLIRALSAGAL